MTHRNTTQHSLRAGLAPLVTLGAVGCSLLIPLDEYVGNGGGGAGTGGSAGEALVGGEGGSEAGKGAKSGNGGSAGTGRAGTGTSATGGMAARGGKGAAGGSDGGEPEGGTDNGGAPGGGGMAGDGEGGGDQGGAPPGGSAGDGSGGMGGRGGLGGRGGRGGRGGHGGAGTGGVAGSSAGAGGCAGADLTMDNAHCGSCEISCGSSATCLQSVCVDSPCDGLCTVTETVNLSPGEDFKRSNIPKETQCVEVIGYDVAPKPPSLVCWQMGARTVKLTGTTWNCDGVGHTFSIPLRGGGYCLHVTQGTETSAGYEFPN